MDILTEGLQKRKTELRTRMDYKNVKPQQKDDYKNVKILLGRKIFLFRCQMTCCAGSRVRLCKTGTKQFESGKI